MIAAEQSAAVGGNRRQTSSARACEEPVIER